MSRIRSLQRRNGPRPVNFREAATLPVWPCLLPTPFLNLSLSRERSVASSRERLWPIARRSRSRKRIDAKSCDPRIELAKTAMNAELDWETRRQGINDAVS